MDSQVPFRFEVGQNCKPDLHDLPMDTAAEMFWPEGRMLLHCDTCGSYNKACGDSIKGKLREHQHLPSGDYRVFVFDDTPYCWNCGQGFVYTRIECGTSGGVLFERAAQHAQADQ